MKTSPLSIGTVPLRKSQIDSEFPASVKTALADSKVRKQNRSTSDILDAWTPSQPLSEDDFDKLDSFVSDVSSRYKKLESDWWNKKKSDSLTPEAKENLEAKMGAEGEVLMHHHRLTRELREASSRAAVQAVAGSLSGAPGIVAAFSAYTNGPQWSGTDHKNMIEVLQEVGKLETGESDMITRDNEVKQVHRSELWKTMHDILDDSLADAKAGNPKELDLQFYELTSFEMIKKIALSAQAGTKVRLNLDAGRLSFPSKDSEGDSYFSLDATPDKIRTVIQLATLTDADVGVSLYPQKKLLNSPSYLMHRKVIRSGDQVLISGMNANLGSGENVDSGYLVGGEAANRLTQTLATDIQASKGATLEDIWGQLHIDKFQETNLRLGKRGFVSLLDIVSGPSPAGERLPEVDSREELEAMAKKAGVKFSDLVQLDDGDYQNEVEKMISGRNHLQLSEQGKKLLMGTIERALQITSTPENLKRLDDVQPPKVEKVGKTRIDIASTPMEREALVASAISQAEQFVFLPGFVVTRAVASAIVARRDQLEAEGKELDVRVIADSGIYPHGGNPNSYGVKHLEDHGIQPRWAKLERTSSHDRKIHAKQLITDKGEITGSTNFSTRALRSNWETSAFVHFDDNNKDVHAELGESIAQFKELWDTSFELSSIDYAKYLSRDKSEVGMDWFVEENRERSIKQILRLIGNYERESAKLHEALVEEHPAIATKRSEYQALGYSYGDSTLKATADVLGKEKYRKRLNGMKTSNTLRILESRIQDFKTGRIDVVGDSELDLDDSAELATP